MLLGLNFEYYKISYINLKNENFGELQTLGMIFYISFIRCYLSFFVKFQIKNSEMDGLDDFHNDLYNISNSCLGKLIGLYIGKLFIYSKEKEFFF